MSVTHTKKGLQPSQGLWLFALSEVGSRCRALSSGVMCCDVGLRGPSG